MSNTSPSKLKRELKSLMCKTNVMIVRVEIVDTPLYIHLKDSLHHMELALKRVEDLKQVGG